MNLSKPSPAALADAERITLGALIQPVAGCELHLHADDFADPVHRAVVTASNHHGDTRPRVDLEALAADVLAECGALAPLGGAGYLRACIALSGRLGAEQVAQAVAIVRDAACRRRLVDVGEDLQTLATDTIATAFDTPEADMPGGAEHAAFLRARLLDIAAQIAPLTAADLLPT